MALIAGKNRAAGRPRDRSNNNGRERIILKEV